MNQIINSLKSLDNLIFLNKEVFLLFLVIIPILTFFLVSSYRKDLKILRAFKSNMKVARKKYIILSIAYVLVFMGIIGVLAQPKLEEASSSELLVDGEFIILMDVSLSSNARLAPLSKSELDLSKDVVVQIIDKLGNSKIQIFTYTSVALPVSDLTENKEHVLDALEYSVYSESTTISGSDLPNALAVIARKKMENSNYANISHIILFTDGQISEKDLENFPIALKMLEDAKLSIISIGVGSTVGWRIPIFNEEGTFIGDYMKVIKGSSYFVSVLNESNLKIIAERTGGRYFHYQNIDELKDYLEDIANSKGISSHQRRNNIPESKDVSWIFNSISFLGLLILALYRKLI